MFNFVILFSVYHDLETRHKKTIINFYRKPPGSCILLFLVFLVFFKILQSIIKSTHLLKVLTIKKIEKWHLHFWRITCIFKPNRKATCKRTRQYSQRCWANNAGSCHVRVGSAVQTDATTPDNVRTCNASWEEYTDKTLETMCNTRVCPQQCWKSCANKSKIIFICRDEICALCRLYDQSQSQSHERYCSSWIMCTKVSLIVCLTIVTQIGIVTFRPCSTGLHSVDSLSRNICTTMVVSDWCITILARHYQRRKLFPQRSFMVTIGCYVV